MITIDNIVYGSDITPTLWEFQLKQPIHKKSGSYIILDLEETKYETFLFHRNIKGDLVVLLIKKELKNNEK